MTQKQATVFIVLGIILGVSHVVGIPLSWKEWVSVLVGIYLIGWGLYQRYEKKPLSQPTDNRI